MKKNISKQWQFHAMLVPGIILVFIFSYIPLYGLVIAFQDYNPSLGFSSPWVGLEHFRYIFNQPAFIQTIWNTLYISFFKLLGGVIVPVIVALLLNELISEKIKRVFQTLVYIPNFLSWVIMAGVLMEILSKNGAVNQLLGMIGMDPVNFLGSSKIFPWTMIVTDIWKGFGFGTVVYLAALSGIDPGLYESAVMDGAKRWKQTVYITLPLLMPTIILMLVLSLGGVLSAGFDQIFNLYSPVVYETGDIIDTYVYRLGIQQAQYSVGTAVGLFKSAISCILVGVSYILADKVAGYRVF
ncbi:protein lplB [Enterococcus alcedinis]|uniref:Protein lplB n=1 Tax=Enterococcus alcedinis TaxID=1274384 RepID=A0A917JJ26_9ENTE|nr:ABC transporter permease subunit [Enterococcus alcedinis]MBP2102944.1 putative aldouronate transport system permease protein [Enterococcus alcedinis]GGI66581.1 protein lplB [Enterococcus alcedinis]